MENYEVVEVVSSTISKVGFDDINHDLFLEFKSGACYLYHDVPKEEFNSIINAESVGTYFAEEIRDEYECTKI